MEFVFTVELPGGDVDTQCLVVNVGGAGSLLLRGFRTDAVTSPMSG